MMPKAVKVTGGYSAATVAEAATERDNLAVIIERRGFLPGDFVVGGKSKLIEFWARGSETAVRALRDTLSGRGFTHPGFWTRVSDTPEG